MGEWPPARGRLGVPRVKTAVPRLSARHVSRPRLLDALDAAAPGQLVLVSAPAGYGKTLLLAEWAAHNPTRTAWVALDEDDNDDRRFWSAVLTALTSCPVVPEAHDLRGFAVPARPSHDHEFVAAVLEAVEAMPAALRLVLDDVHELTATDPLHGLGTLVRDHPRGFQVVVAGRSDPPLPLGRLRLNGRLCEVRAGELRFSVAEADAMFAAAEIPVRSDQVRQLVAQTEGWAAGLRLASLSMRGADPDVFVADLVANSRAVSDYLVTEILDRLPRGARELLASVSVCDRLSASLATALSGRPDAGEVLDVLEHETSLVISSGEGRVYYRVHPLLRSHLLADLRRRRPDLVTELHRRAAAWFADRDQPVAALAHARRAADTTLVTALLRRHALPLVGNGRLRAVREALAWLVGRGHDDDVRLAMVGVLVDLQVGDVRAARAHLDRADDLWPADPPPDVVALRNRVVAGIAASDGDVDAMLAATEEIATTDTADPELAVMGRLGRALALAMAGRRGEALRIAQPALDQARELGQGLLVAHGLAVLALIAAGTGEYRRMTELAEHADRDVPPGTEWAATSGAAVTAMLRSLGALLRADSGRCLELVGKALSFADPGSPPDLMSAMCLAVRGAARVDVGHRLDGLKDLRSARGVAASGHAGPALIAVVALLEHRAASLAGRHDLARTVSGWADGALGDAGEVALLRAWQLSELGRHRSAHAELAPLLDGSRPLLTPWALIDACVVECRLALRTLHTSRARGSLSRALELTEAMDARRPLATAPPDVVDLLVRHLGSFGALDPTARRVLAARHALGIDRSTVALTGRERAVLNLLPSQRSFDEIARDLTVSHSTVKTHVRAIYSKLDAGSRREAVDIARRHGLLLPEG
ncbi:helix-turn-helix transcriptional regulator [Pseudonocardia humida]|uniref:LuxR family transcriptional regulator n=1 Tax=Pseudonocardia humida TaxID=2800819 RepID=A0ABT1AC48_9PSEU|nr:LuxR C-terminal-related transcriptional regulator [Pseudonocardia humida]MCO1660607.1 LuxR family transcriptional regulator [Pseudonocardia humida]